MQIYDLLSQLPADENILKLIDDPSTTHQDIFPTDQPFKSKYSVYALREYLIPRTDGVPTHRYESITGHEDSTSSHSKALLKGLRIVVGAISDRDLTRNWPSHEMQLDWIFPLVDCFVLILQGKRLNPLIHICDTYVNTCRSSPSALGYRASRRDLTGSLGQYSSRLPQQRS